MSTSIVHWNLVGIPMSVGRVINDLLAHDLVLSCQSKKEDITEIQSCNLTAYSPVT